MEREVFILPNCKSSLAWQVEFSVVQQHETVVPIAWPESDDSSSKPNMRVTKESADVRFCACKGFLKAGQSGQLSAMGDQFFQVTITSIEPEGDHVRVFGKASRDVKWEWDR